MIPIDRKSRIIDIAAEVPGAVAMLESFGVDYACGGGRSVEEAAWAAGIDPDVIVGSLKRLAAVEHAQSWNERPLPELIEHLVAEHHRFVREELTRIAMTLADLCSDPAMENSYLRALRAAFMKLTDTLLPHIREEEQHVFPAIEAMIEVRPPAEDVRESMRHICVEHGAISEQLRAIRELRLRLILAGEPSPRCTAVLDAVATLEAHLHEYMFLENCILFPRAMSLHETPQQSH